MVEIYSCSTLSHINTVNPSNQRQEIVYYLYSRSFVRVCYHENITIEQLTNDLHIAGNPLLIYSGLLMNILRADNKSPVQRGFFANSMGDLLLALWFLGRLYNFCNFVIIFSLM